MTNRYYRQMRDIHKTYKERGFEILAFPCNQFFRQESWNELRIKNFVRGMGADFPLFGKVDVNGRKACSIYKFLRANSELDSLRITWNFGKFLVNREGRVVQYFGPRIEPNRTIPQIESLL
mmetsp:Transcript_32942/g.57733  ORF Transcript_32942/g.57733 Transcript_32942/m.57733 type:complete len:121 (-) Transcript_32942:100-462(-)